MAVKEKLEEEYAILEYVDDYIVGQMQGSQADNIADSFTREEENG